MANKKYMSNPVNVMGSGNELFRQSPVLIVLFVSYALLKIGGPWNTWPRRVYKRHFAGIRPFSIGSDGKKVGVNLR